MKEPTDAQIVIVGAGLAGLAAANRAASLGRSVLVIEQGEADSYMCNSRIATGALGVAHSDAMASPETLFRAIVDDTEGYAAPDLARMLADNAGRALRWLREENVAIKKVVTENRSRWVMVPPRSAKPGQDWKDRGADLALRVLTQNLLKRGGRIEYATRARHLSMRDGTCVGLRVEAGRAAREIPASAVILADGGFQSDMALLKRFVCEHPESFVQRNAGSARGDALRMAEAVGGRLTDASAFYGHLLAREALENSELWPYPTIDSLASSAIVVNTAGERFVDEGLGGIPLSNAIARLPDPLSAVTVFDEAIWASAGRLEFIPPNPYVREQGGNLFAAASLADLAQALGLPAERLIATVHTYNQAVEAGRFGQLHPTRTPGRAFGTLRSSPSRLPVRPICEPPYYAIRLCAGISYTLGGVMIDSGARVIGKNDKPIPGLLAAGSCTGGLEGGPVAGYVGGLVKALCTGLAAGESAAMPHVENLRS